MHIFILYASTKKKKNNVKSGLKPSICCIRSYIESEERFFGFCFNTKYGSTLINSVKCTTGVYTASYFNLWRILLGRAKKLYRNNKQNRLTYLGRHIFSSWTAMIIYYVLTNIGQACLFLKFNLKHNGTHFV